MYSISKNNIPWNKGKKMTYKHGMLGKHHSEETKKKWSIARKGKNLGNKFAVGHTPWSKGESLSKEIKLKMSLAHKGISSPKKGKPQYSMRGSNNPNWKGGISSKNYLERRKFQEVMQKSVFERDNYTCQLCGIKGVDLQVDHIQSWADYIDLRFSMDNCRTLCAKCHYKITFGREMPTTVKGWGHNLLRRVNP